MNFYELRLVIFDKFEKQITTNYAKTNTCNYLPYVYKFVR